MAEFKFTQATCMSLEKARSVKNIFTINGVSSKSLYLILYQFSGIHHKIIGIVDGNNAGPSTLSLCRLEDLPVHGKQNTHKLIATHNNLDTFYELFVGDTTQADGNHYEVYATIETALQVYSKLITTLKYKHAYIIGYSADPLKNVYYQLTPEV